MEEYFTNEIKRINRELTQLKTTRQTSAGAVPTVSQTMSVPISLGLDSPNSATGIAYVKLALTEDTLIMATLDSYFDDITKYTDYPATTRYVQILVDYLDAYTVIIKLLATGDASDRSTLSGGGSVTITKQLTVRASDEFTMEIING